MNNVYWCVFRRVCFVMIAAVGLVVSANAQHPYRVEQRWALDGEGSWDYMTVDPVAHRLYIAHQTRVQVVDTTSGKSVGSIEGLTRTHGVVLLPKSKIGFISDGGANQVIVFDRETLAKSNSITAGKNPDGMTYEPTTHSLWVFNGGSKNVTVISTDTLQTIDTISLPGKPEFPVADGHGNVYVNIEDRNAVARIDAHSRTMTAQWPLSNCKSPSGLAIDVDKLRLFSVCDEERMAILDANTGRVLATPKIGDGPDAAAFDPRSKMAFSSNEDGTISMIDTSKPGFPVAQSLSTMYGARTMALDDVTGTIYTVSAKFQTEPASAGAKRGRPTGVPGSFTVLVIGNH